MSTTSINFHHVVSATAKVQESNGTKWLELNFADRDRGNCSVALFSTHPQALLDSIAGRTLEAPEAAEVQP